MRELLVVQDVEAADVKITSSQACVKNIVALSIKGTFYARFRNEFMFTRV
jgi:hypothetical protein